MKDFENSYIPKLGCLSSSAYFSDTYEDADKKERDDMMVAGFVHEDIIAFMDNRTENVFWALVLGGFQKNTDNEDVLRNIIGDAHGDLLLVRKGSKLLEALKEDVSESSFKEGEELNSISESCRIKMPQTGSLSGDLDRLDTKNTLLEFRKGVEAKCIIR